MHVQKQSYPLLHFFVITLLFLRIQSGFICRKLLLLFLFPCSFSIDVFKCITLLYVCSVDCFEDVPLDQNVISITAISALLATQVFQGGEAFPLNVFMLWNKIKNPSGREEATSRLPHRIHNAATYLALNRFTSLVVSLSLEVDRLFFFFF